MDDQRLTMLFVRFRDVKDADALAKVFDTLAPGLLKVARHLTRDKALAEDLLQTTFLTAMEKASRFDDARQVRPWLAGILIQHARHQKRKSGRVIDTDRIEVGRVRDPGEIAEGREVADEVDRALDTLPERYRKVLLPRLKDGLKGSEIARKMGRDPGVVRMQIHRGLDLLKRALPQSLLTAFLGMLWSRRALASVRGQVLAKAGVSAPVVSTLVVGGLVMSKKIALIAVGAAMVISASLWVMLGDEEDDAGSVTAFEEAGAVGEPDREVVGVVDFQDSVAREIETIPPQKEVAESSSTAVVYRLVGKVLDARGMPVPAVSVFIDDSDERTATSDLNGLFFIDSKQRFPLPDVAPPHVLLRTGEAAAGDLLLLVVARRVDLSGTVVDEQGVPLPGVTVEAETLPLIDFPEVLDKTAPPRIASVMTDAHGWFELKKLPLGHAVLRLEGSGYVTLKVPVDREIEGKHRFTLQALAEGVRVVSGTVKDHLSRGVAGALVGLEEHRVLTDEWGAFNLVYDEDSIPHDGAKLYAAKAGFRTKVVPDFGIDETALFHTRVELRLEGSALEITGRFLDAQGMPIDGAVLSLWHEPPVCGELTAEDLALPEGTEVPKRYPHAGRACGVTDAEGAFSVGGLSDRSYRFRIYDNKRDFAMTTRAIPAGRRDVEIRLPADAFRDSLTGYVVNRRGEPMPGLDVAASMLVKEVIFKNGSKTSRNGVAHARTGEDGSFEFTRLCRLDDVFLSVRGESAVTRHHVTVPPDAADAGVRLVVERRCHFRVELSDPRLAQRFHLLDEEGEQVSIERIERDMSRGENRQPLVDGKSQILTTTDRAAFLVLEGEQEISIPIQLDPDEVTVVRH